MEVKNTEQTIESSKDCISKTDEQHFSTITTRDHFMKSSTIKRLYSDPFYRTKLELMLELDKCQSQCTKRTQDQDEIQIETYSDDQELGQFITMRAVRNKIAQQASQVLQKYHQLISETIVSLIQ